VVSHFFGEGTRIQRKWSSSFFLAVGRGWLRKSWRRLATNALVKKLGLK